MKAHHLTATTNPVAEAHPIYKEAYNFARELNKLTEGKQLNVGEIHTLFTNAEQAMTAGGGNRTMLGKAGEMAGALGAKIKGLAQALQDTTPVKGVDSMFDDLKQKASMAMGKSTQGSTVLRALDQYKQIVQKHPNTSKFFWGVAGVLTGILTGGAGPVVALGAIKMIDSMVQGNQLSTSIASGLKTAGTAMGAKALAHGVDAAAQGVHNAANAVQNFDPNTLNPFHHNPVDPSVVDPNNVVPPQVDPNNVVPPKPTDPTVVPGAETATIKAPANGNLSTIAQQHGTSVEHLQQLNPSIKNPDVIAQGQQIVVPAKPTGAPTYDNGVGTSADTMAKIKSGQIPDSAISQQRAESFKFKAGRELLEGIQLIVLPTSMMVDKQSTVQKWALNESLGRKRNSVQLTEAGVMTLFMNLQRISEAVTDHPESQTPEAEAKRQARAQARAGNPVADLQRDQQGGTVRSRPANGNDAAAQAKSGNPANTSTTAGPLGGLPGGNVGGLATGTAPAGNTMPYLAADPEGKFDTKYKGGTSTGASRGIESGLGRLGNWVKDKWKDSTTKVTANGLKRHWKDAGEPTDSDQIALILQRLKVPNEMITQLYQQLNFPAPALPQAAAPVQGVDTDANGNQRTFANGMPSMSQTVGSTDAEGGAGGGADQAGGAQGGAQGGTVQQAATKREIDQEIDDMMRSLLRMDNRMQPAMVKYIRDRLDQHFPAADAASAQQSAPALTQDPASAPALTQDPASAPMRYTPARRSQLGPSRTGTMGESRKRTYGGKYVKESADQKLAREFENFLLKQE